MYGCMYVCVYVCMYQRHKRACIYACLSQLHAFEHSEIPLFILMGNFSSEAYTVESGLVQTRMAEFDALCDLIVKYKRIASESHFVFVPGRLPHTHTHSHTCHTCILTPAQV